MFGTDWRLAEVTMTMNVQEAHLQASSGALRRGLKERRQMWSACHVVRYLGHHLILLGKRLELYGLPQTQVAYGQDRRGGVSGQV